MTATYDHYTDTRVAGAVRNFWNESYPQTVVAFFYQKYDYESDAEWEFCAELTECEPGNYVKVIFQNDFCEGQTCVKNIKIVPLDEIIYFYAKQNLIGSDDNAFD